MSLERLRSEMARRATLPAAERHKLGRTLGHLAMELEKAGGLSTPEEMDLALAALAIGAGSHSYPQRYHMSRARLMQARRDLLGLAEPVVAAEKAATLDIEAGGVAIADAALDAQTLWAVPAQTRFTDHMARFGFFYVSFGGDGVVKIRLRLHLSGPVEPQSREFRRLREATPEGLVTVTSGALCITGGGTKRIHMQTPNGDYCIAAYGLGIGRKPECLVLLSPLHDARPAPLTDTPMLEL